MIVIDDKMLSRFRLRFNCECCGEPTPAGTDPHHVVTRGVGGGTRLDVPLCLISLARRCHDFHGRGGDPTTETCLNIIGARYGYSGAEVLARLHRMIRAPKEAQVCRTCQGIGRVLATLRWRPCVTCRCTGIMLGGRPYRETPRRLAGS